MRPHHINDEQQLEIKYSINDPQFQKKKHDSHRGEKISMLLSKDNFLRPASF